MKRAIFICPSPFEVGTYFRAHAFARYLVRHGLYEIDLICTTRDQTKKISESFIDGVRVVRTPLSGPSLTPMRGWNLGELFKRITYIWSASKKYDLVYSFEYQPNVAAIAFPLAKAHGALHFNDWCDWYAGRHHRLGGIRALQAIDRWMEELPRRRVDCVTTICQTLYDRALSCGVSSKNLMLIREGADAPTPLVSRAEARVALGFSQDDFLVVTIYDQEMKILETGMEALAERRPGAKLALIGNAPESSSSHILKLGRVSDSDLHLWLSAADCAWLPLADSPINQGRLPHKIGHFRRYGLPLITTRVSDVVHIHDPDIHFAEFSGKRFSDASLTLPPFSEGMRAQSIVRASEFFDWDKLLQPLAERLQVISSRRQ